MNNKAARLAVAAIALAVIVYIALSVIWPYQAVEQKLPENPSADSVFAGDVNSAPEAPTTSAAHADVASKVPTETVSGTPAADGVATIITPPDSSTPPKPPADDPNAVAGSDDVIIEGADAFPREDDSGSSAVSDTAATESAPAQPYTAPSEPESASPAVEHAPAAKAAAAAAPVEVLKPWWPEQPVAGQLNLLYAGQAAKQSAIALLFDSALSDPSDTSGITVTSAGGKPVSGHWELNSNRRMLIFNAKPGRYTVQVPASFSNERGQSLGQSLQGPIYIR